MRGISVTKKTHTYHSDETGGEGRPEGFSLSVEPQCPEPRLLLERLILQPVCERQPQIVAVKHVPAWAFALTHLVNSEDVFFFVRRLQRRNETTALSLTSRCSE
ncbi:hypothetical protein F2P81_006998 [Scophthalmus maximus]|uniref:Uncharacterized protein n=1 Tax=Scophthalmus maximus TaxID=52904 RepID=A0A6A4TB62_SCOMX|nr:hypothetical protein F2P81_006998 [Scophthalmus maximus]